MIRVQPIRIALLALALSVVMTGPQSLADTTLVSPTMPLTRVEQAGRVAGIASQIVGRGVFAQPAETLTPAPYFQRDYRAAWLLASLNEKAKLAERIGNQGRARFATERGWSKIIGSQSRGIVQGPDSVYWDPYTHNVRVLEAKGGSSQVTQTYGTWQGTNRNTVRSAKFTLESRKATEAQKLGAARVIKAAQANQLQTGVVHTSHVHGTPDEPRLKGEWDSNNVAKEATEIERRVLRRNPSAASAFRAAAAAQQSDMLRYRTSQGVAVLGIAGSGLLAWDAYQQSGTAWEMWNDPIVGRTILPYLQTGFAIGRWAESGALGLGSASQLGWLGRGGLSVFGRAAGKWFLPIAVGVEGLSAGVASYEYATGRISQREFYRRTTGPAIFAIFTTGGAFLGGILGASAGGVGAIPGAATGASVGGLIAVPAQFAADWTWNWYYHKFDEKQRHAVNLAVERYYELSGH